MSSSMSGTPARSQIRTSASFFSSGMQPPSGLEKLATTSTALMGCFFIAASSASSCMPSRGWVGISSALSSSISRT